MKATKGGCAYGAPPFGKQAVDGKRIDLDAEKTTEEFIFSWHQEQGLGPRPISRRLNEEGIPSKRGGRWRPTTVARILDPAARAAVNGRPARDRATKKVRVRRTRTEKLVKVHVR
ncbi:recombinase family protein [Streptomyces sp. 5.8]|uniref:recombinase family protein n=1 Tax=Streptomyces sp. 5.8 TaxID=3406571 RepID=UPI003BB7A76B